MQVASCETQAPAPAGVGQLEAAPELQSRQKFERSATLMAEEPKADKDKDAQLELTQLMYGDTQPQTVEEDDVTQLE